VTRALISRRQRPATVVWVLVAAILTLDPPTLIAAETVKVTLPATITFAVTNVSVSTTGSPSPTAVSFSNGTLTALHRLHISVKADADFIPPSGTAIPASKVSWTTSGAAQGTGSSGVLSTSAYAQLYQGNLGKQSGSVNVTWTLAAPGTPLRAGSHSLTMRWKLEAF